MLPSVHPASHHSSFLAANPLIRQTLCVFAQVIGYQKTYSLNRNLTSHSGTFVFLFSGNIEE